MKTLLIALSLLASQAFSQIGVGFSTGGSSFQPNLITNGTFNSGISGWTLLTADTEVDSITWDGSAMKIIHGGGAARQVNQIFATVSGGTYVVNMTITGTRDYIALYFGVSGLASATYTGYNLSSAGTVSVSWTATTTTSELRIICGAGTSTYDNIECYRVK